MSDHAAASQRPFLTPFNIIAGLILLMGAVLTIVRFTQGLGPMTNLSHNNPWGIWIGFDLLCGVALAAGGYVTSAACYIFGLKKYHSAVRPAILTAFLGYALVVLALTYDVGRPWRLPYPFFVQSGTTSILFEVGLCVMLYLTVLLIEYTPAIFEWLGMKRVRSVVVKLTLVLTIFGVVLSTLHQSSLGSLYLIAPSKLHPLWYSQYLPVFFFVSSIAAGLSMVIVESSLSHRYLHHQMDEEHIQQHDTVVLGFARGAAYVLAGYFMIKIIGVAADGNWSYLATGYGAWFLVEILGFAALPAYLFALGVRERKFRLIRWTAGWTVLGIVVNRFNVSLVAFNWQLPDAQRYFPSFMEIGITIFIITLGLVLYKFCANRMPVLHVHPEYTDEH
jgi:Ni/Fe-hydrogenase subunit HybB-like protein